MERYPLASFFWVSFSFRYRTNGRHILHSPPSFTHLHLSLTSTLQSSPFFTHFHSSLTSILQPPPSFSHLHPSITSIFHSLTSFTHLHPSLFTYIHSSLTYFLRSPPSFTYFHPSATSIFHSHPSLTSILQSPLSFTPNLHSLLSFTHLTHLHPSLTCINPDISQEPTRTWESRMDRYPFVLLVRSVLFCYQIFGGYIFHLAPSTSMSVKELTHIGITNRTAPLNPIRTRAYTRLFIPSPVLHDVRQRTHP